MFAKVLSRAKVPTCCELHRLAASVVVGVIVAVPAGLARGGEEGVEGFHAMFVADACVFDRDAGLPTSTSKSHQYPIPAQLSICQADIPASYAELVNVFGLRRDGAPLLRRTGRHFGEGVLLQNGDNNPAATRRGVGAVVEISVDDARIDEVCGRMSREAQRQLRLIVYSPGRGRGSGRGGASYKSLGGWVFLPVLYRCACAS